MTTRRATSLAALGALALAAGLVAGCGPRETDRLALVGATVVDGSGGAPLRDVVIIVRAGRIDTIAPRGRVEIPKSAERIDLTGRWIIPGLIDAHAHATRWALPRYLAAGITTLRDVHGHQDSILALRNEVNLNAVVGPRLFVAGAMIDGAPATYPDAAAVGGEGEARKAVDQRAIADVDFVKTYTRITPDLLRAILDEATTLQLPVTAHLGLTDAVTAARLGVRAIEHLSGIPEAALADPAPLYAAHRQGFFAGWNASERSWARLDSAGLARVARALAERRTILVPTLVVHENLSRADAPDALAHPDIAVMPDSEIVRWNLPDLIRRAGWTAGDFAAFRAARAQQDLFVREFRAAGGTIVAGSDASNQLLPPGPSLHRELELLVNAGLTPGDALLAATRNAAELLGADSLGRVRPGAAADLVVLDADPLVDIRNTRRVERVMLRGRLLDADSIRQHW
ncbi:MAG TPA: amidohydrolase family protein [Gemmatimonadales bacterium]|nr:amidohydrolase family protein [Gemmatimonadales bacterium]